jgi:ABC-type Fe3+/spermidine/putrescine transport system ATPase subunit
MTGLSVRGATYTRGPRQVLEDASFTAPAGAITALLGPPGAGKTTLLAAIAGLLKLTRGTVWLDEADATGLPAKRRGVTLYPPGSTLPESGTVAAALRRLAGRNRQADADALILQLGMDVLGPQSTGTLSHGEALLALSAARVVGDSPVVLVDEAGMGLDPAGAARLHAVLRLRAKAGATVLLATRAPAMALAADHLVLLAAGRVLQTGTPASVYAEPLDAACALMTGEANILYGQVRELRPGGFIWTDGRRFIQAATLGAARPSLGADVCLCLRPERVALLAEGEQADNEVEGEITDVRSAGGLLSVSMDTPLGPFMAAVPSWGSPFYPAEGMKVRAGWAAGAPSVMA